jgi:hypothetical protein
MHPNWLTLHEDVLNRFTKGDSFRYEKSTRLQPPPPQFAASVRSVIEHDNRLGVTKVLDVSRRKRGYGGSAGLVRFWVLVEREGKRDILELKQAAPPAVDVLGDPIPPSQRMEILTGAFLKHPASDDHVYITLKGTPFEVRDRARMSNVHVKNLSEEDRKNVLGAQAAVMANLHRDGWSGVGEDDMRSWLDKSSKVLSERWEAAFQAAQ